MSTELACVITAAVDNGMRVAAVEVCQIFAEELVKKGMLTCKSSEAMEVLDGMEVTTKRSAAMKKVRAAQKLPDSSEPEKKAIRVKPDMVLPFCGNIEESWCKGVRFNHGLHTQCTNGAHKEGEYCKTCQKSAENSASNKPTYGDIRDRAATGALEYRDSKGKLTTCYANVAKKMGLDLKRAEEVATAFGWTIPAEQLVETATKRGRPGNGDEKKTVAKKTKKVTVKKSNSMDDQIAQLVAEAAEEVLGAKPDELSAPAKKTIKVKAKKVKKVDPEKEAAAAAKKAAEKLVKEGEREAKKKAAAEVKAAEKLVKEGEREAKKKAAAEVKAKKAAEKLVKEGERELKKQAAAEAKALKDVEKLAKAEAKALKDAEKLEVKAAKDAEKLAKAEAKAAKDAEKLVKAEEKAAKDAEKLAKAEAKAAKDAEKLVKAEASAKVVSVDSSDEEEAEMAGEELVAEPVFPLGNFEAELSASDDEDDVLTLDPSMVITHDEVQYFKTSAFGYPSVLFSFPEGETVGVLDEATGEIQELSIEEE